MAAINKVAGTASLILNGEQLSLKGSLTVRISGRARPGVVGQDGRVHGYKEEPQVPMITGTFTTVPNLDLEALGALDGATVQADLANGHSAVLRDAWVSNDIEVSPEEGEVTIEFSGLSGEWLT